MIFVSFPSDECVDEVVDNRTNNPGYKLFPSVSHTVVHFMNGFGRLSEELFLMYIFV